MGVISFLLNFLMMIFVGFRTYAVLEYTKGNSFIVVPYNHKVEIAILFLSVLFIYLIFKRKHAGGILLLGTYIAYYGTVVIKELNAGAQSMDLFFSALGILLALLNLLDLIFNNTRLGRASDGKTDWFYKNKEYDRNDDPRQDKNRYRIM